MKFFMIKLCLLSYAYFTTSYFSVNLQYMKKDHELLNKYNINEYTLHCLQKDRCSCPFPHAAWQNSELHEMQGNPETYTVIPVFYKKFESCRFKSKGKVIESVRAPYTTLGMLVLRRALVLRWPTAA